MRMDIVCGYHGIYVNELLNKIGCSDEYDAFEKLIQFWNGYRTLLPYMDNWMIDVIKEFYVISNISVPFKEICKNCPIDLFKDVEDIEDIKFGKYEHKINFLNNLSSYKILKSKFIETKYGYLLDECINEVFLQIHQVFASHKIDLYKMLVSESSYDYYWRPLSDYTLYNFEEKDKEVIISDIESYAYKNDRWNRLWLRGNFEYKHTIGYILKAIECYIRDYLGYRKLKFPEKSEILEDKYSYGVKGKQKIVKKIYSINLKSIIEQVTLQYLKKEKIVPLALKNKKTLQDDIDKEEKIEIVFNKDNFEKIREKSDEIQKALVIEENVEKDNELCEENVDKVEHIVENVVNNDNEEKESITFENIFEQFVYDLTIPEREIIKAIIQNQDVEMSIKQIAKSQNEMLEVMVSNINDKALEVIGDTIIESNMESIYEEYRNEIKQVL